MTEPGAVEQWITDDNPHAGLDDPELFAFARAHDAEDARHEAELERALNAGERAATVAEESIKREREREALLARLVETIDRCRVLVDGLQRANRGLGYVGLNDLSDDIAAALAAARGRITNTAKEAP